MENKALLNLRSFSRRVAQEGIILLENKNNLLPLVNQKVALFGRIQNNYYKSGTGSGGLVNVTDVPTIIDAVLENPRLKLNLDIFNIYRKWEAENPFNYGNGQWASEPWSQIEMALNRETISKYKKDNEVAVVVIGRTAGEDKDNSFTEGSYLLTKNELQLIKNVKACYRQVVVLINAGNIIDMNFVKENDIDAVLLGWHGGQDGARALIDVLTGYINPSGKLPNTIPANLKIYPALKDFTNQERLYYEEDIYVGYRFYETFYPEEVLYPFGYGLSYTTFNIKLLNAFKDKKDLNFTFEVTNTGNTYGKEVIQLYKKAPQGLLGKPKFELIGFFKTKNLNPNEKETITMSLSLDKLASYDDHGSVFKSAYVLEKGKYIIYYGNSVKDLNVGLTFDLNNNIVVEKLEEALAPTKPFQKIKPKVSKDKYEITYEEASIRTVPYQTGTNIIKKELKKDSNITLFNVYQNNNLLDTFVYSLEDDDLFDIVIGEGMSSPKVTPGTASAFGGITSSLKAKGLPAICCADGPSGIRMDSGLIATSLPNGTLIASTFNQNLIEELYYLEALEMRAYNIDILLGPGMNIHRHPLCGRNFEYFSEDPLLTGIMASAVVRGLKRGGVNGAMKHFTANNQETARTLVNSIISERALREIYLKGYEIAVKETDANVMMTSYNPINDIWTAGNYELNTKILRGEWGFNGIVMTDWWAQMNDFGQKPSKQNIKAMVIAQNDLYMVVPNVKDFDNNLKENYLKGLITRSELERSAKNIIAYILTTPAFKNSHKIKVRDLNNEKNSWFEVIKQPTLYPYITKDNKPLDITASEENITNEKLFDLVESKNNISYALLNQDEVTLYNFGIKEKKYDDPIIKVLNQVDNKDVIDLPVKFWEEVRIDLNRYRYPFKKNDKLWTNIEKDKIIVFNIKADAYGKYIAEFKLSSDESAITQMPFSVYIDSKNAQTLTTNGTEGHIIKVKASLIIDTSNKYLSIKFHKTGLNIHEITIKRHG